MYRMSHMFSYCLLYKSSKSLGYSTCKFPATSSILFHNSSFVENGCPFYKFSQNTPNVLDWRQIWTIWRPIQKLYTLSTCWEKIIFSDEKLFNVEQLHNRQNDRILSAQVPGISFVVEHRQVPPSVLV